MKRKLLPLFIFSILVCANINAQNKNKPMDTLKQRFENFDYVKTISLADSILRYDATLKDSMLIEIYRMKGISEFALQEDQAAMKSFLSILKINNNYQLDSAKTSPKIISFYKGIRQNYLLDYNQRKQRTSKEDSLYTDRIRKLSEKNMTDLKNAMLRSFILPGLGHIYLGQTGKGLVLTTLSTVSISGMIYFIIDSNKKEDDYLNATTPQAIANNFDTYNSSYKLRNAFIISSVIIWLYSQIDLLFFHDFDNQPALASRKLPHLQYDSIRGIQLSYRFHF